MKRFATGISLLIALALSMTLAPASGQESTPVDPMMGDEGLELVVSRSWSIDWANASLVTSAELPDLQMAIAMVNRYETPEQAATAFELFTSLMADQMSADEQLEDFEVTALAGLGDQASAISTTVVESEGTWVSRLSVAQEGRYLYTVTAIGSDADRVASADGLLAGMVNDSDPGEGDGTFMEDGSSTGGPWDVMPADDDPALAGLISYGDAVFFPEPSITG